MKIAFPAGRKFERKLAVALSVALLGGSIVIGWSASGAEKTVQQQQRPYLPLAMSINQVMVAVVDDAAHMIWEGGNTQKPLTKGQWQTIELHTYQLQAAATLISMGGTGKSDAGWTASPGFQANVRKLSAMAITARHAVDTKDQKALRKAGDDLVTVCEGCHKQFKPSAPTEGIYHKPYYDECTNSFVPE
jgi:cytochrome c556